MFAGVAENICTYVNPDDPNSVGLTMDVADMAASASGRVQSIARSIIERLLYVEFQPVGLSELQ